MSSIGPQRSLKMYITYLPASQHRTKTTNTAIRGEK
jgi:hypothetical protein